MNFFQLNWIIIFLTLLFLFLFIFLEKKYRFWSEKVGVKAFKIYLVVFLLGAFSAFLNYVALVMFGSWEMLVVVISILFIVVFFLSVLVKRKLKIRREKKEFEKLKHENEELKHYKLEDDVNVEVIEPEDPVDLD